MTIAVVTPWHNHPEFLTDYMAAIDAGNPEELHIIDNGSRPGLPFAQIRNDTNQGFSAACNSGLAAADADAVLFLNNDIYLTSPDWLDKIRAALEPGVLVGAMLRRDPHADIDGHEVPYLDGWCLAGMREDLDDLGGFDATLAEPAYYSDNLLCLEARAAGMTLREAHVGLQHKLNGTAKNDPRVAGASAANRARYVERARELLTVTA